MSVDFTKWSVQQMRDELVRVSGMSNDEVSQIKGKATLAEKILQYSPNVEERVANFGEAVYDDNKEEEVYEQSGEEVKVPKMGSPGWQEYVLDHLTPDEWSEKNGKKFPRAAGLRRITSIICGPIVSSGPIQAWPPVGNFKCATILYGVSIQWTLGMKVPEWLSEQDINNMSIPVRTFSEIADCTLENTPAPYNLHLSATAASKAEGRVFKKILQLNIATAEEMSELAEPEKFTITTVDTATFDTDMISPNQMSMISTLATRLELDVEKALKENGFPSTLQSLTRGQAAQMMIVLNRYQTNTQVSLDIPDSIKSN